MAKRSLFGLVRLPCPIKYCLRSIEKTTQNMDVLTSKQINVKVETKERNKVIRILKII